MTLSDVQHQYEFVKAGVHSALHELKRLGETSNIAKLLQNGSTFIPGIPLGGGKLNLTSPVKSGIQTVDEIRQKNKKLAALHAIFRECPDSESFQENFCKIFIQPLLEVYFSFESQLKFVNRRVNDEESDHLQAIITLGEFCGKICFNKMVDSSSCNTQNLEEAIRKLKYFKYDKILKTTTSKWSQWTVDDLFIAAKKGSSGGMEIKKMSSHKFFEIFRPAYFSTASSLTLVQVRKKHLDRFSGSKLKDLCWRRPFKSEFENLENIFDLEILKTEDHPDDPETFMWSDRVGELKDSIYVRLTKDFSFKEMRAVWEILGGMSKILDQVNMTTGQTHEMLKTFIDQQTSSKIEGQQIVVGYIGSWAMYREGNGKFEIDDIDPSLCSHLIYCFAGLNENDHRIKSLDPHQDLAENYGRDGYRKFTGLKKKNPNLKTLLSIGGWVEGSEKFSKMVASEETRAIFIESVLCLFEVYRFDGLDVHWEFPGCRGGVPEDKENFVLLLKELKEAFIPKNLLLTAAVSAWKGNIDVSYDVPKISQYLDYIHLMAYNMHGHWEDKTNHHSSLYGLHRDDMHSGIFAINYWINHGAQPEQIVLGMCAHGRGFTLKNPKENGIQVPISGPSDLGPYTKEVGVLSYNEIHEANLEEPWIFRWDQTMKVPFAYRGSQWIGFDDPQSIRIKAEYIRDNGLGGGFLWFLEYDDFKGLYGPKYALTGTIKNVLHSKS